MASQGKSQGKETFETDTGFRVKTEMWMTISESFDTVFLQKAIRIKRLDGWSPCLLCRRIGPTVLAALVGDGDAGRSGKIWDRSS